MALFQNVTFARSLVFCPSLSLIMWQFFCLLISSCRCDDAIPHRDVSCWRFKGQNKSLCALLLMMILVLFCSQKIDKTLPVKRETWRLGVQSSNGVSASPRGSQWFGWTARKHRWKTGGRGPKESPQTGCWTTPWQKKGVVVVL